MSRTTTAALGAGASALGRHRCARSTWPEHLARAPDGASPALDGFTSVPACAGCDYGSADAALWSIPLDGCAPVHLSTAGGFASAGLAFQPTFPDPPLIEVETR